MLVNELGIPVPPIHQMGLSFPNEVWGESLELVSIEPITYVFILTCKLRNERGVLEDAYLYGAKFSMDGARISGTNRPEMEGGFFLQFYVLLQDDLDVNKIWTLTQHSSVTYSDRSDNFDYIPAFKLKGPELFSADRPPVWKKSEAQWPMVDGKPMIFLDQAELKNTPNNSKFLTVDEVVFLFYSVSNSGLSFKLVMQEKKLQTLRGHYAAEAKRMNKRK